MKRIIQLAGLMLGALALNAVAQPVQNPTKAGTWGNSLPGKGLTELQGQVTARGGEGGPGNPALVFPWIEHEGVWNGDWQPVPGSPGEYTASWRRSNSREHPTATLHITINSDVPGTMVVSIQRNGPDGTCLYSGRFTSPTHANGTYHCNFGSREVLPWNATVTPPARP